jgi:LuxR family maltose regulon positive regulatory protein
VALDTGDNDPVRFWRYLFSACQTFDTQLGQSALTLLNSQQPAFEAALTLFINELAQLPGRHILVLEDYHLIASPQIHEMSLFLLDHLPETLHLMILTRHDPPLPLARLRTRHELNEIGAAELRFSLAETRELLQQSLPLSISTEAITRLDERTEGWVAALRLVVLALQGKDDPIEVEQFLVNFGGGHGHVLEYLVEEVLVAQPVPIQEFLLRTTFLNRLSASLCNAVMGRSDSALLLEQMERANLFLISLDGAQQWYRYHGLFAEAISHYARHHLAQSEINTLFERASLWYEEHGLLGEAFETAIATHAYERAADLLEQIVAPQLVQNQFHTLRRWLEELPIEIIRLHPQLCMIFAVSILFTTDRHSPLTHQQMLPLLGMAEEAWREQDNRDKLGELLAFRALVSWFKPNIPQSIAEAREALAMLPADNVQWRGISLIFVGLDEMLRGRMNVAHQELLQGLALNQQAQNIYGILDTLLMLGRIAAEQGNLRQATHYYEQTLAEIEQKPMVREQAEFRKGRAFAGLGALELHCNHLEAAEHYAIQAVEIANAYAGEDLRVEATLLLAKTQHALGQKAQAQELLHALVAQTKVPHALREIERTQIRLALAIGDLTAARRWSATPANQPIPLIQREAETLLTARIQLAQDQPQAALALLSDAQQEALSAGRGHNGLEMLITTALAAHALKATERAKQALCEALSVAQPQGYQRIFLDAGEPMVEMLRGLLREIKEENLVSYVRTLLVAFAQEISKAKSASQDLPPIDSALLVEPLSGQERRVLRLLAADLSNPEIADELVVSLNTVKTHVKNIFAKLDVHSREEASDLARQLNLV